MQRSAIAWAKDASSSPLIDRATVAPSSLPSPFMSVHRIASMSVKQLQCVSAHYSCALLMLLILLLKSISYPTFYLHHNLLHRPNAQYVSNSSWYGLVSLLGKYFYTNRIVLAWNSLSDTVVTASSVNAFRKQLNAVNLEKFLIVGQLLSKRVLVA